MGDQGRSDFYTVFIISLCARELKQMFKIILQFQIIGFEIRYKDSEKLLKLACEYEVLSLPNTKVSAANDHGEN